MSVRAHFIKKIDYDPSEVFNLWHDAEFVSIMESYANFQVNEDVIGFVEIGKEDWEIMKECEDLSKFPEIVKDIDKLFEREDNDFAGEWVRFYCF